MTEDRALVAAALAAATTFRDRLDGDDRFKNRRDRITKDMLAACKQVAVEYGAEFNPLHLLIAFQAASEECIEAGGWLIPGAKQ